MADVKFLKGTQEAYETLGSYDAGTFYLTESNLYIGSILLSNNSDLVEALARISANEASIETITSTIGSLDDLNTTAKTDIIAAINEVLEAVGTGGTDAVVSVTESDSDDYAKIYTLTQGGTTIGTINIPRDMVVSSGTVEVNPDGQEEGTYLVLKLANADADTIYINVGTLVDLYTAAENATEIQLTVDSTTREISAIIVDGAVSTDKIADDAIVTAKIADANVTLAKLSTTLQESIANADSAVQEITEGATNGTISVDGTEVHVAGLGGAAYESSDAFDAAGAADTAETNAKAYTDDALTWASF